MPYFSLLPDIRHILTAIRRHEKLDGILDLILQLAGNLSQATHGSFLLLDDTQQQLKINNVYGSGWTDEKKGAGGRVGEDFIGKAAGTGMPHLCRDVAKEPNYQPQFSDTASEVVLPVIVNDRVWGLIRLESALVNGFDERTLSLLTVFGELATFAIILRLELAEEERLQKQLLQSEKLASLGETIAGIAHEINNPLTAILGHASLLTLKRGSPADDRSVQAIMSESRRTAELVRGLLDFSRKETGKRELIGVNELIRQVLNLKKYQLTINNVRLVVRYEDTAHQVQVCPQQIKQVLLNLIANAEQAFSEEAQDPVIQLSTFRENDRIRITVEDNGPGIPGEMQKQIFDPFFTTKAPGAGTGLGLSISYSIIDAHGGRLSLLQSSPQGTTFMIELPMALPAGGPPPVAAIPGQKIPDLSPLWGRVLLVDDEQEIVEATAAYLKTQRLDVAYANSALEALNLLRTHSFDLIISDLRMPGMDGIEFYEKAMRMDSRYIKRFIFISGYLLRQDIRAFLDRTGAPWLQKPFSFEDLHGKISELMGAPPLQKADLKKTQRIS